MYTFYKLQLVIVIYIIALTPVFAQKQNIIYPGEIWPDKRGKHIQAHGGGIIKLGKTYYWYGEERSQGPG